MTKKKTKNLFELFLNGKISYDLLIYGMWMHVKNPKESLTKKLSLNFNFRLPDLNRLSLQNKNNLMMKFNSFSVLNQKEMIAILEKASTKKEYTNIKVTLRHKLAKNIRDDVELTEVNNSKIIYSYKNIGECEHIKKVLSKHKPPFLMS
jgi:hypothetical protein